jgi:ABC-type enterobactin transport system permease subunit
MSTLVFNERAKYFASFINTISAAAFVGGALTTLFSGDAGVRANFGLYSWIGYGIGISPSFSYIIGFETLPAKLAWLKSKRARIWSAGL